MDFPYDGADDLGGRILWGRVGILVVGVLFFFLLGRCTGGGSDIDPAQVTELQSEVATLTAQNNQLVTDNSELTREKATLENQLAGLGVTPGATDGTATPGTAPTDGTAPPTGQTGTTTGPPDDSLYVVQAGDTLSTIAEQVYGDPGQYLAIATANGISGDDPLTVGQQLVIPANPDSGAAQQPSN